MAGVIHNSNGNINRDNPGAGLFTGLLLAALLMAIAYFVFAQSHTEPDIPADPTGASVVADT